MNLIEAWNKAEEGQRIQGNSGSFVKETSVRKFQQYLGYINLDDLISTNWEIVKEKKKVVIEGVRWGRTDKWDYIYPYPATGTYDEFRDKELEVLSRKIPMDNISMTMTLEWED